MPLTLLQRPLVLIFADELATITSLEARLNTTQQWEVDELIEHSSYGLEEPIYSQFHGNRGTHAERLKALRNLSHSNGFSGSPKGLGCGEQLAP